MNSPQTVLLSTLTIEHLSLYLLLLLAHILLIILWINYLHLKYQVVTHCLS